MREGRTRPGVGSYVPLVTSVAAIPERGQRKATQQRRPTKRIKGSRRALGYVFIACD